MPAGMQQHYAVLPELKQAGKRCPNTPPGEHKDGRL